MEYDIMGKKITSVSGGYNGLNLSFDDGVYITIKAVAHVGLDSERKLTVNSQIEVTTGKIELKTSEKVEKLPEDALESIKAVEDIFTKTIKNLFDVAQAQAQKVIEEVRAQAEKVQEEALRP